MKAAVIHHPRDFTIRDIPEPDVEPDGVIIRVKACGICGSDLHVYKHGAPDEWILGHEFSGDIVEVGVNVRDIKKGERVVAMSGLGCGECYWCRQGKWIRCSKMSLLGYGIPGAFAEYVSVPNIQLGIYAARLPDSLTYEVGATAEPLSVALYAVAKAKPQPEDTIVVTGVGVIGLCVIKVLKVLGAARIIASGRRAKRLELAKESGADIVIDASREDVVPVVDKLTSSRGADIVFECAGSPSTFQQAQLLVHRGGKIVLVGLYEESVTWNPSTVVSNDVDLISCGLRFDLPGAIDIIQSGRVDTASLITHEFTLENIKEGFETQLTAEDAIKVLIKPQISARQRVN